MRYKEAKKNLLLSWIGTIPLAIFMLINMLAFKIPGFEFLELFIGGFVIFYAGKSTIKGAWIALTHKHTNMDTLIFFGAVASWTTTLLSLLGFPIASFGAIGAMIVAFHITGRFIESHLRDKAAKEIKTLLKLQAKEARVLTDKGELTMPIETIKKGFIVLVKPGERIPVDGEIIEGVSGIGESMITGESIPVQKTIDDEVTGGSLNLTSPLKIKVTEVGEDSFLSQMIKLIQQAQGTKVPIQALADRITMWFVPTIITLAFLNSVVWYLNFERLSPFIESASKIFPWIMTGNDPLSFAVFVFVATIVIACPCALGLATPMALVTGTGLAAKRGLIIRNAEAIQTSKEVSSGTDLAIDSADIIITKGGIYKIVDVISISKLTFKVIKQNLFWAFFYNTVAIPMAMAGLLHLVIAEIAMAVSSITVVLNSLRIGKIKFRRGETALDV